MSRQFSSVKSKTVNTLRKVRTLNPRLKRVVVTLPRVDAAELGSNKNQIGLKDACIVITKKQRPESTKSTIILVGSMYFLSAIIAFGLLLREQMQDSHKMQPGGPVDSSYFATQNEPLHKSRVKQALNIAQAYDESKPVSLETPLLVVNKPQVKTPPTVSDNSLRTADSQNPNIPGEKTLASVIHPVKPLSSSKSLRTNNQKTQSGQVVSVERKTKPAQSRIKQIFADNAAKTTKTTKPLARSAIPVTLVKAEVSARAEESKIFASIQDKINAEFRMAEMALNSLLSKFEVAYQFGDLIRMERLLSSDVISNEIYGFKNLQSEYRKLFRITEMRRMNIIDVDWKLRNGRAFGEGAFRVKLLENGASRKNTYTGTVKIVAKMQDSNWKISGINYVYYNL